MSRLSIKHKAWFSLSVILLLTLMVSSNVAQTSADSLLAIWQNENLSDSVRATAYEDYIYDNYFFSKPDSALILLEDLEQFAGRNQLMGILVDLSKLSGYILFRVGRYDEALTRYQRGLDLAEELNYELGAADILLRMGHIFHDNENIIAALKYYQRSLKIYERLNDENGLSAIYNEFGSIYRSEGDFNKSLEYYYKSIEVNNETGDTAGNAPMYTNIGELYLDQNDFVGAMENFRKGLEIYRNDNDYLGIASSLAGMGNVYAEQGNQGEALKYLEESLDFSENVNDAQGSAATLLSIGLVYLDLGRPGQALGYCDRSFSLSRYLGDVGGQSESCECLYEAYKGLKNVEKALTFHELMNILNDSMHTEETAIQIKQMEFANQLLADSIAQVEREMQMELAHQAEIQKKNMNRNLAIAVGLFFLVISIGLYRRWQYIKRSKAIIEREKERSENLLLNILPSEIADELKKKGKAEARDYDLVSILFTDFKGFTEKAAKLSASELIDEINHCFRAFDFICEECGVEKIKTIGDAYMAAGGLPVGADDSVRNTITAGLKMQAFIQERIQEKIKDGTAFEMRVGIHTGPVVAGIVGVKKFQYDVWGDTVNTAARMESNGEPGRVNISQDTYELVKDDPLFKFTPRGAVDVKGKGKMPMWFVSATDP